MGAAGSKEAPPSPAAPASECPAAAARGPDGPVYDVYNRRTDGGGPAPAAAAGGWSWRGALGLDPRNNMPAAANQMPAPGQAKPISTERAQSNIPKGGTAGTWQYPSPQMFYNALVRKGKADDVEEDDMDSVVRVHNGMNEDTWREVTKWELLHRGECGGPKLRRFVGRPEDLSPLARVRYMLGGPLPFDRHDWYVDRCGREVRYVIDFYFNEDKAGTPEQFDLTVRPALDSFDSALDRTKMFIYVECAKRGLPCPISGTEGLVGKEMAGECPVKPEVA